MKTLSNAIVGKIFFLLFMSVSVSKCFLSLSDEDESDNCNVDDICEGKPLGAKVSDGFNCHNFYTCLANGPSDPLPCPDGQYFNSTYGDCVQEDVPCNNACDYFCRPLCQGNVTLIPDPDRCDLYYSCDDPSNPITCPINKPFFNGYTCVASVEQCCQVCTPHCTEDDIYYEIMDPLDCRSFYVCYEIGVPDVETHGTCAAGEIFGLNERKCVLGDNCTSYCSPTSTTSTTTSSTTTIYSTSTESTYPATSTEITSTTPESTSSTIPPSPAPPNCNMETICNGKNGTLVSDPKNCSNYYFCENYEIYAKFECVEGKYFDGNSCQPELTPCFPQCVQDCARYCDEKSVPAFIADPTNCNNYYVCTAGVQIGMETCSGSEPYFDGIKCVDDKESCCSPCLPYCFDDDLPGNVLDPYDCTSYYQCNGQGVSTISRSCMDGEKFDYVNNECADGTDCTNYCSTPTIQKFN